MIFAPFFLWVRNFYHRVFRRERAPKSFHYHLTEKDVDPGIVSDYVKPTKAYADQRQKAKRNRRRKPNKRMRNLYQL